MKDSDIVYIIFINPHTSICSVCPLLQHAKYVWKYIYTFFGKYMVINIIFKQEVHVSNCVWRFINKREKKVNIIYIFKHNKHPWKNATLWSCDSMNKRKFTTNTNYIFERYLFHHVVRPCYMLHYKIFLRKSFW